MAGSTSPPARHLSYNLYNMDGGVVVIGFLGTTLDRAPGDRWKRWRPTVDLCRHEDLLVRRLELLAEERFRPLTEEVTADIRSVSPETEVRVHHLGIRDP